MQNMIVLVFDTETTGLPDPGKPSIYETDKWPHILQLSYVVYDTCKQQIVTIVNRLVKIPSHVVIPAESTVIHKITPSMCETNGMPIKEVITEFNIWVARSDYIVGHNVSFDKRMIIVESIRNSIKGLGLNLKPKCYCTMRNAVDVCKISAISKTGTPYFKFPKLHEVYSTLFTAMPAGLHDALTDVLICLRCYCILTHIPDPYYVCDMFKQSIAKSLDPNFVAYIPSLAT